MALASTHLLTEMGEGDQYVGLIATSICGMSGNSGSLNLLEV